MNSFFDQLSKHFQSHEIQAWFRITKQGVFVHEDAEEPLVRAYQEWTKTANESGEGKSIEKCRKRLYGESELPRFYVLDGNRCLVGVVLPKEQADPRTSKIPAYQAPVQSTENYIHPRDPLLQKFDNPKPRVSPQEGFFLDYVYPNARYEVSEAALKEFAAAVRGNIQAKRQYPELGKSLRNVILPLGDYLKVARPLASNESQLIPLRLRARQNLSFVRARGMTFALENSRRLIACYSIKGKALRRFMREEFDQKNQAALEMRGFSLGSPKKHSIGKTFSQGIAFHLDLRTFQFFLRQLPRASRNAKRLPQQFTVRDVLERFAGIFRNSKPVDERTLLGKLRRRESFAKYRQTGNWIFVIQDKNSISSCVHLSEQLLRPERKDKQIKQL